MNRNISGEHRWGWQDEQEWLFKLPADKFTRCVGVHMRRTVGFFGEPTTPEWLDTYTCMVESVRAARETRE